MLNFNLSGRGKYSGKGHHAFMQRLDRLQGEREAHEEKGLIERVL